MTPQEQYLQQMRQMIQRVMRTDPLTTSPFGSPVDDQGMQLDDPEAPVDDVDVVTDESIQEFIIDVFLTTSWRNLVCLRRWCLTVR